MLVRTHPLAALLLIGALLLTGCSTEEPEPKIAEAPSTAPAPVKKETAEEFIRRWNEAEQRMQNSGDTTEYRAMTAGCTSCASLATRIEEIYENDGSVSWAGRQIESIEKTGSGSYRISAVTSPTTYSESRNGPDKSFPGGEGTYVLTIRSTKAGMQLTSLAERSDS